MRIFSLFLVGITVLSFYTGSFSADIPQIDKDNNLVFGQNRSQKTIVLPAGKYTKSPLSSVPSFFSFWRSKIFARDDAQESYVEIDENIAPFVSIVSENGRLFARRNDMNDQLVIKSSDTPLFKIVTYLKTPNIGSIPWPLRYARPVDRYKQLAKPIGGDTPDELSATTVVFENNRGFRRLGANNSAAASTSAAVFVEPSAPPLSGIFNPQDLQQVGTSTSTTIPLIGTIEGATAPVDSEVFTSQDVQPFGTLYPRLDQEKPANTSVNSLYPKLNERPFSELVMPVNLHYYDTTTQPLNAHESFSQQANNFGLFDCKRKNELIFSLLHNPSSTLGIAGECDIDVETGKSIKLISFPRSIVTGKMHAPKLSVSSGESVVNIMTNARVASLDVTEGTITIQRKKTKRSDRKIFPTFLFATARKKGSIVFNNNKLRVDYAQAVAHGASSIYLHDSKIKKALFETKIDPTQPNNQSFIQYSGMIDAKEVHSNNGFIVEKGQAEAVFMASSMGTFPEATQK